MKKMLLFLTMLFLSANFIMGQSLLEKLETAYEKVDISSFKIKHQELQLKIKKIVDNSNGLFKIELAGKSFDGREINLIKVGNGKRTVLIWSQMHGDEPTATMAILDILFYLFKNKNENNIQSLLNNLQILFIPMLNPDGAENFTRRNSQDIDINRDAQRLQTPEARILKSVRDRFSPEFGFNMHDQDPYFAVGETDSLVSIALLAPAYDDKNSTNNVRKKAKQICSFLNDLLVNLIPGHISRYNDEFEPRAFGDNIQSWGTSTITIESGGWYSDPGKEKLRKINFIALLSALSSISDNSFSKFDVATYNQIPFNKKNICDLLLRKCNLNINGTNSIVDVAINFEKVVEDSTAQNRSGKIVDIGDLSTMGAIENINASAYNLKIGSFYFAEIDNLKHILKNDSSIKSLLDQGITSIISESDANLVGIKHSSLNLFFLNTERYTKFRMMLNLEKPILPNPDILSKMQDECFRNPFIFRDKVKMNRCADLVLLQNEKVVMIFINGIKVYENGNLFNEKSGIIYIDK